MAAFANLDELANRQSGGNDGNPEPLILSKEWRIGSSALTTLASQWQSSWLIEGAPSAAPVPPIAGAYCDNTTIGGLRQPSPGGGRQKFLVYACAVASSITEFIIADRLFHHSGLSGLLNIAQPVPVPASGAMRGPANGVGNQIWLEIYAQVGATATTVTVAYTNQDGIAKTSPAIPFGNTSGVSGTREQTRMIMIPLAPGDTGVRSVQSVTLGASTLGAGDFGVTILRSLLCLSTASGGSPTSRSIIDGPVHDVSSSCLWAVVMPNTPSAVYTMSVFMQMVER